MLTARRFALPLAAVFALAVPTVARARPSLDAQRLAELDRWEVLTFSDPAGGGIDRGKAIGVFEGTPEEIFRVVTDYARWPDYLPRVRAAHVAARDSTQALVEITAELPWPVGRSKVIARYTHERLAGDTYRIQFVMVTGQMKQYLGSLYIEPWAPGRTALTYELVAEPDVLAPRSLINRSIRRSAGGFVHALRQRVNDMHRLGLLHPQAPASPSVERAPLAGAVRPPAQVQVQAESPAGTR
jgi:ribosome-associated toxin RatA of RatAB toxin-antitoxin module